MPSSLVPEIPTEDPAGSEWIGSAAPISFLRGSLRQRERSMSKLLEARDATIGLKSVHPDGILAIPVILSPQDDISYSKFFNPFTHHIFWSFTDDRDVIQKNHRIDVSETDRIQREEWTNEFSVDPMGELGRLLHAANLEGIEIVIPCFDRLSDEAGEKIIQQISSTELPIRLKLGVGKDFVPPDIGDSKVFDLMVRDDPEMPKRMKKEEKEPTIRLPYEFTIPLGLTEYSVNTAAAIGIRLLQVDNAGKSVSEIVEEAILGNHLKKFHLTLTQKNPSEITAHADFGLNLSGTPLSRLQRFVNNLSVEVVVRNSNASKVGIETELVLNPIVKKILDLAIRIGKRMERPLARMAEGEKDEFSDIPETTEGIHLLFTRLPELFVRQSEGQQIEFTRFQVTKDGFTVLGNMDVPEKQPDIVAAIDASPESDGYFISRDIIDEALKDDDKKKMNIIFDERKSEKRATIEIDVERFFGRIVLVNDDHDKLGIRVDSLEIVSDQMREAFPDELKGATDEDIFSLAGIASSWLLPAAMWYLNTNLQNVSVTGFEIRDDGFFIQTQKKS